MKEAQIQAQLIEWWELAHKGLGVPDKRLLLMIPNGAYFGAGEKQTRRGPVKLAAIRFANLKRQGFRQGVPDLFLAVPRPGRTMDFAGLWLELKRERGGVVSAEQRAMHELLLAQGYAVALAHGFDEAVNAIVGYLADSKPVNQ